MVEVINARCVQPKNNNNDDSPVNPGSHICGGGSASGAGGRADFNGFRNESEAREAAYRSDIIQGMGRWWWNRRTAYMGCNCRC